MAYFHAKQIVHRDLKPQNIMVTTSGQNVKVIDFGLSDADADAIFKMPAGTRKYASPEQQTEGTKIDQRADIYSFGKILETLLPEKRSVIEKCTRENREERYYSAQEVIDALEDESWKWKMAVAASIVVVMAGVASWQLSDRGTGNELASQGNETEECVIDQSKEHTATSEDDEHIDTETQDLLVIDESPNVSHKTETPKQKETTTEKMDKASTIGAANNNRVAETSKTREDSLFAQTDVFIKKTNNAMKNISQMVIAKSPRNMLEAQNHQDIIYIEQSMLFYRWLEEARPGKRLGDQLVNSYVLGTTKSFIDALAIKLDVDLPELGTTMEAKEEYKRFIDSMSVVTNAYTAEMMRIVSEL